MLSQKVLICVDRMLRTLEKNESSAYGRFGPLTQDGNFKVNIVSIKNETQRHIEDDERKNIISDDRVHLEFLVNENEIDHGRNVQWECELKHGVCIVLVKQQNKGTISSTIEDKKTFRKNEMDSMRDYLRLTLSSDLDVLINNTMYALVHDAVKNTPNGRLNHVYAKFDGSANFFIYRFLEQNNFKYCTWTCNFQADSCSVRVEFDSYMENMKHYDVGDPENYKKNEDRTFNISEQAALQSFIHQKLQSWT